MSTSTTIFTNDVGNVPSDNGGNADNQNENVNYLDELVGEGRKYASIDELAKGYAHLQRFNEQVKKEAGGLRSDLSSRLALEELVNKLASTQSQRDGVSNQALNNNTDTMNDRMNNDGFDNKATNQVSRDDIAKLVRESLSEEQTRRTREQNRASVVQEMRKAWGNDYVDRLRDVQRDLGLSDTALNDLAEQAPAVFYKAVIGTVSAPVNPNNGIAPRSEVNAAASAMRQGSSAVDREFNDLEKLRETDPRTYWSPSIQNKLLKLTEQRMRAAGVL